MSFIKRIITWLSIIWRKLSSFMDEYANPIASILGVVYEFANSKTAKTITELIPGEWDDKILAKTKKHIGQVLMIMELPFIKKGENISTDDLIQAFSIWLRAQPEPVRQAIIQKILSQAINLQLKKKDRLKDNEADLVAQLAVTGIKAGKNEYQFPIKVQG